MSKGNDGGLPKWLGTFQSQGFSSYKSVHILKFSLIISKEQSGAMAAHVGVISHWLVVQVHPLLHVLTGQVNLRSRYLCSCKFSITLPTSQRQIAVCKILLNYGWKQRRKVSVELECYGETVSDSTTILRQFSGSNGLSLDILMLLFYIIPWKTMFF